MKRGEATLLKVASPLCLLILVLVLLTFIVRLSPRPELGPKAHDEVLPHQRGKTMLFLISQYSLQVLVRRGDGLNIEIIHQNLQDIRGDECRKGRSQLYIFYS